MCVYIYIYIYIAACLLVIYVCVVSQGFPAANVWNSTWKHRPDSLELNFRETGAGGWSREASPAHLFQRGLEYGVRAPIFCGKYASANGRKRFSTNTHRNLVLFLQTSRKIFGNLREFSGECNLGILYCSSLLSLHLAVFKRVVGTLRTYSAHHRTFTTVCKLSRCLFQR